MFGSVSKLINKLSIFEELSGSNPDFETWESIAYFLEHVSKHLVLDYSKLEDMAKSSDSGDFINQVVNNLLYIDSKKVNST